MSLAEQSVTDSTGAKPALPWGVRALANELPDSQGARSLKRLAALLEQGHGWQKALADPTLRIPEHVRGLLQASLHSPDVAGTLERFVHLNRRSVQLRREMWLSVAYPLAVIVALGILFCCFEFFVVAELGRMYENLFQDFGMTQPLVLPAMTRVMIAWSGPPALVLLATLLILGVLLPVVWSLSSGSHSCQPAGGSGHAGSGFQSGGGTHSAGGCGHPGGGLKRISWPAAERRGRCRPGSGRTGSSTGPPPGAPGWPGRRLGRGRTR